MQCILRIKQRRSILLGEVLNYSYNEAGKMLRFALHDGSILS